MHDLDKIRNRIIRTAFPELMAVDVQIEYKKLEDALLEYGGLTEEGHYAPTGPPPPPPVAPFLPVAPVTEPPPPSCRRISGVLY